MNGELIDRIQLAASANRCHKCTGYIRSLKGTSKEIIKTYDGKCKVVFICSECCDFHEELPIVSEDYYRLSVVK